MHIDLGIDGNVVSLLSIWI